MGRSAIAETLPIYIYSTPESPYYKVFRKNGQTKTVPIMRLPTGRRVGTVLNLFMRLPVRSCFSRSS